jgi:N-acetylneuraminate epimerase
MKTVLVQSFGCLIAIVLAATSHAAQQSGPPVVRWEELPALPDDLGFGGMYAGVSGGALIVAGGANFPDEPFWEGGQKRWYDTIYVLEDPKGAWQVAQHKLPQPMGYGVSVIYQDSLILCGAVVEDRALSDVVQLKWDGLQIELTELPALPQTAGYTCGALLGSTIYIAGGVDHPDATEALHTFWALDLAVPSGDMA